MNCPTSACHRLMLAPSLGALALIVVGLAQPAFAQSSSPGGGVDDSNGVFQLEGNTTTDTGICFGIVSTGPVISTPGTGNSCPSGQMFVAFGTQTDDWDKIFAGTSTTATATSFAPDKFNTTADDQFTGGSTKDTNDFSVWLWGNGKPQAKDDFEHAYAAAYTASNGHLIIVAGADRYDNSGSSTAGFWFVQDPNAGTGVTTPTTCATPSGCSFGGTHKDGDILIISQFTTGGTVSTIQVFTWVGNGPSGSISAPVVSGTQCNPLTGSATLCGTVNGVPVLTGGWSFSSKPSDATTCSTTGTGSGTQSTNCMSAGEFLEVGLDVTALANQLGKPVPCISRFFAESRSSGTGISSTLSDLVKPVAFNVCSITATKSCTSAAVVNGTSIQWNFMGTITGKGGTLSKPATGGWIADNPDGCGYFNGSGKSGTVCSPTTGQTVSNLVINQPTATTLPPGPPGITYSGSFQTNFNSSTLPNLAQASGVTPEGVTLTGPAGGASWLSGTPPTLGCAPEISANLTLSKTCSTVVTSGSPLTIEVDVSGTITQSGNEQVDNITITDSPAATLTITCGSGCSGSGNGSFNLAPGGTASYTGSFTEAGSAITCTPTASGRCLFNDSVTASGTGAINGGTIGSGMPVSATCSLCPNGTCSNP